MSQECGDFIDSNYFKIQSLLKTPKRHSAFYSLQKEFIRGEI